LYFGFRYENIFKEEVIVRRIYKEETDMRKSLTILLMALMVFASVACASAADDIKAFPSCKYCGMDREKFAFSRTYIEYDDGKAEGFCSIHCTAVDLAVHIDRSPKLVSVGDYGTKALIDAEKAFWVIGGNKPGVMTKRAKWAFTTKDSADAFVKESGGSMATFDGAMKATYEDMYQDTKMIRDRRAARKRTMEQQKPAGVPAK
jgi:copper chaperone NosL